MSFSSQIAKTWLFVQKLVQDNVKIKDAHNCLFVMGIHQRQVDSAHKDQ